LVSSFLFEYRISHSLSSPRKVMSSSPEINFFLRIGIAPNELQYRMYPTKKPFRKRICKYFFHAFVPISPGPFPSPWPIKRFYLQKYILDCHSILEYLILSENNHPSINHDFLRKNRLGFRCREFRLVYLKREQIL
jgi:hypothetical protein